MRHQYWASRDSVAEGRELMREVSTQQYSFQQTEFAIIFFKCSESPNKQLENGKSFNMYSTSKHGQN